MIKGICVPWAKGMLALAMALLGPSLALAQAEPAPAAQDIVKASGRIEPAVGDQPAQVAITATIRKEWHIYSLTQAAGGPVPTKIELETSADYRLRGGFVANPPPVKKQFPEALATWSSRCTKGPSLGGAGGPCPGGGCRGNRGQGQGACPALRCQQLFAADGLSHSTGPARGRASGTKGSGASSPGDWNDLPPAPRRCLRGAATN